MKKRILHLITGLEVGGAERALTLLLPRLQADCENHVCALLGRGPMGRVLEASGITVHYLEMRGLTDIGGIWRFRRVIKEYKPHTLVTYLIHADLFGRIFGRLFGIKRIFASQRGSLLNWEFLRIADRMTKWLVTRYIVQTDVAKEELMRKLRLPGRKFTVIPNAINVAEYSFRLNSEEKLRELGVKKGHTVMTCVGRLRQGKGHEYLLEAFESLYVTNPNITLLLVGDGEREDELRTQVVSYASQSDIIFLGNRPDVKEILYVTDIFVLPTLGEGMSNAILEAMVSKLPCVVTDIKENKVLITHEKTGLLVPPADAGHLARVLADLIPNKEKQTELGTAAFESVKARYDIIEVSHKLKELLISS